MNGGAFDYKEWHISDIAETIGYELEKQGKEKEKSKLWMEREYYEKYPEEKYNVTYTEEVQEELRNAIEILKKAHVYARRVDYFFSGDDSEESFLSRLREELGEIDGRKD